MTATSASQRTERWRAFLNNPDLLLEKVTNLLLLSSIRFISSFLRPILLFPAKCVELTFQLPVTGGS
ncbi:hypothetical protein Hanom_Chr17g01534791 [Helianthus anomalus]